MQCNATVHHSLALPFSAEYAASSREGFSFFDSPVIASAPPQRTPKERVGTRDRDAFRHAPGVERYLDDLCAFLRSAGLIQSHPDNYFQFMCGQSGDHATVHFDGSPVGAEELAYTQNLLRGFDNLLRGEDAMQKLRTLVRDGPPSTTHGTSPTLPGKGLKTPLEALNRFYAATRRLMLGRDRREDNDAAAVTLLPEAVCAARDTTSPAALAMQRHQKSILDLVISHGMSPKKQHEVRIMRDTIHDLVDSCNCCTASSAPQNNDQQTNSGAESRASSPSSIETVINIGEGKGYVSRAVALCDHLQVVGLDCNPAHKERAVERFESLLETSLSSRDGRPRVNLLYEPRGHVASIACRVGESVDWTSLLQGHVHTCSDASHCCSGDGEEDNPGVTPPEVQERKPLIANAEEKEIQRMEEKSERLTNGDVAVLSCPVRAEETVKLSCVLCDKVVRLENTTVIMKHIYSHLKDGITAATSSHLPSPAQMHMWNETLSQHAYVAKLTEAFFTVTDVETQHLEKRKDAALLLKRPRESGPDSVSGEELVMNSFLTLLRRVRRLGKEEKEECTLQPAYTARGYRAVLLLAKAAPVPFSDVTEVQPALSSQVFVYVQVMVTIVGYDGGADCHQVYLDPDTRKHSFRLYRLPSGVTVQDLTSHACQEERGSEVPSASQKDNNTMHFFLGDWELPAPDQWAKQHVALVLSVLPPALPSTPAVCVPSITNTALIGLHPCGDLGSNVCHIFTNSGARGLLLVSCCWHSLTPIGFPLSAALKRREMTTNKVSLLLATQPLDAWSTASPEGHRSSAKLLFFRSLFKLLWSRLVSEWKASTAATARAMQTCTGGCDDTCVFPEAPPHLEPAFLRRMSRDKETITFSEFVDAAAADYLYAESAKNTAYTPWNIGRRCATCRTAQEAFVRTALKERHAAQEMTETMEEEHFAQFLGLTVLRMWMCHLVESLLLLDRALYLHERLSEEGGSAGGSAVSLVPLFDGALSPRMYGVLARRGGSAWE